MLSPPRPDHSGEIDPRKVRRALLRYRLVILRVVIINILLYIAVLFFVLHDILSALLMLAGYLFLGFCMPYLAEKKERQVPIEKLPECMQPNIPIYNKIVALWATCCQRSGYSPGCVYVIFPLPDSEFGDIDNFGVVRTFDRAGAPPLFIAAQMFHEFSRNELYAGVLHEGGHLRTMPTIGWFLVDLIALPMNMILECVAQLRALLPVRWKIPKALFRRVECFLHTMSGGAAHHADEYSADTYAVESQNTAAHLVSVLTILQESRVRHALNITSVAGEFHFEQNTHLYSHPSSEERIRRLLSLRRDRS